MPLPHFLMMTTICIFQTILFTYALKTGNTLTMILWGLLLSRNLYKVYLVDRVGKMLTEIFKKKD